MQHQKIFHPPAVSIWLILGPLGFRKWLSSCTCCCTFSFLMIVKLWFILVFLEIGISPTWSDLMTWFELLFENDICWILEPVCVGDDEFVFFFIWIVEWPLGFVRLRPFLSAHGTNENCSPRIFQWFNYWHRVSTM